MTLALKKFSFFPQFFFKLQERHHFVFLHVIDISSLFQNWKLTTLDLKTLYISFPYTIHRAYQSRWSVINTRSTERFKSTNSNRKLNKFKILNNQFPRVFFRSSLFFNVHIQHLTQVRLSATQPQFGWLILWSIILIFWINSI